MLNALRKSAKTWVAKVLIALLVLSFAIWGVNDFLGGATGTNVATVGDTTVSAQRFDRALAFEISRVQQQIRQPLSRSQAVAFGLPNQVISQLVSEAALDDVANKLNLGLSDEKVAADIVNNPALRGPDGRFDRSHLQQTLRANNLTETDFIEDQRGFSERRQIAQAVAGGVMIPQTLMEALHRFRSEERTIRYVAIEAGDLDPIADPDDTALQAYFDTNLATYRAPEYRALEILDLTVDALINADDISDADAERVYDTQQDRFRTPERRRLAQIVFTNREEAEATKTRLDEGLNWDELLSERGAAASDVDLGLVTLEEMVDQAVATVAFETNEGDISDVINGRFGPVLVRVTEVQAESVAPFQDVKDQIKSELALDEATDQLLDVRDTIEDGIAGGAPLADIAGQTGLALKLIEAVDANGLNEAGGIISDLPQSSALVAGAFESDVGIENPPIEEGEQFVWYNVTGVTPARDRTLDEVRDRALADWRAEETEAALTALAQERLTALSSADSIDSFALEIGKSVATIPTITRRPQIPGVSDENATEIFATSHGENGVLTPAGRVQERWVFQVSDINVPDFNPDDAELLQVQDALDTTIEGELLNQYIASLQDSLGVSLNQALLNQILTAEPQHGGM